MKKLAIITTHPIQYHSPLFALLAKRANIHSRIFYTWGETVLANKYDPGFNKVVTWDIPLLDGYDYEFVTNTATEPGSHHYKGICNPNLISRIDAYEPDALLIFGWSFQSHLNMLRHYKHKKPVLFRGDSTLLDDRSGIRSLMRTIFLRWVYRHVDVALYVGHENRRYFQKMGLRNEQLVFAPHVVDNTRFQPTESSLQLAKQIRAEHGISKEDFVFLFAGKFEQKKDPLLLIKAFQSLKAVEKVHLVMIGNGRLESSMKAQAGERVHFIDFVNQSAMPSHYQLADCLVLPSAGPGETWGLAINEAMASGIPVIASDRCGAAADLIDDNKTGKVFQAGNGDALREAMQWMLDHRSEQVYFKKQLIEKMSVYCLNNLAEVIEKTVYTWPL